VNSFIKKFKDNQLLEKSQTYLLKKNDSFTMFGCMYKVMNDGTSQVILMDEKGNKISFPREKLKNLLEKGMITKAFEPVEDHPTLVKKVIDQQLQNKKAKMSTRQKEYPVGTVHNGRKKVSANPSKWVDISTGHSFDDHSSETSHNLRTDLTHSQVNKTMSRISHQIHPEDIPDLSEKLHKYIEMKQLAHNMFSVGNKGEASERLSYKETFFKHMDKVRTVRDDFINSTKKSIKKRRGSEDGQAKKD
jgi:hypothetical protein